MNADEFIALTPGKVVINQTGDTYTVVSGDAARGFVVVGRQVITDPLKWQVVGMVKSGTWAEAQVLAAAHPKTAELKPSSDPGDVRLGRTCWVLTCFDGDGGKVLRIYGDRKRAEDDKELLAAIYRESDIEERPLFWSENGT